MGALKGGIPGSIQQPINHSKGCGGIMRVAPLGLYYEVDDLEERKKWTGQVLRLQL